MSWLKKYQLPEYQIIGTVPFAPMAAPTQNDQVFSLGSPEPTIHLKLNDPRKIRMTTGQKINPNVDLVSGEYTLNDIDSAIKKAKAMGLSVEDAYNLAAMDLQETGWGNKDSQMGHVLHGKGNTAEERFLNAYSEKMKEADRLKIKDPMLRLQVYNGMGVVTPKTEKNYHGFEMQKIYGVPIPKEGISMRKNPLYGKQIVDLRDNVLKKNPEFVKYINSIYPNVSKKNGGWLDQYQEQGLVIPGVTDFKMPLNRTDATGLSIQEKQRQDVAALEMQRVNEATAKRQFIGTPHFQTLDEQRTNKQKKKQFVQNNPNTELNDQDEIVSKNPDRDFEGKPLTPNAKRWDKGLEHIMNALEATSALTGSGQIGSNLLRLGASALEKKIGRNLVSKSLKNFTSSINPTLGAIDDAGAYIQMDPIGIMGNRLNSKLYNPTTALNTANNTITGVDKNLKNSALEASDLILGDNNLRNLTSSSVDEIVPSFQSTTNWGDEYFKKIQENRKELEDLLSSNKITFDKYIEKENVYKKELTKKLGLEKSLGSGNYGEVFELPNDPSKVIKLGSPYGNRWTPEIIENLKSIKQNSNIAIPEQVDYFEVPSMYEGYKPSTKEVMYMPNLNETSAQNLNLNKRDRYALFLKQARQLRDKGVKLDVENLENFKFNKDKGVFDIYDVNPGYIHSPVKYMQYIKNKTRNHLLENMLFKQGGQPPVNPNGMYDGVRDWRIPGGNITMKGVPFPVLAKASNGMSAIMQPGGEYNFPGASHVDEYPMYKFGGSELQNGGWLEKYQNKGFVIPGVTDFVMPKPVSESSALGIQSNKMVSNEKLPIREVVTEIPEYIVKSGDTLSKIASAYNTTPMKLAQYNNIANPNVIGVNQKIKIPVAKQIPQEYQDWETIKQRNQQADLLSDEQKIISYYGNRPDDSYLVVDKKNAKMNLYKGNKLVKSYEVGTGANAGDAQTVTRVINGKTDWTGGNKSTGAGVYTISRVDPKSHEYFDLPAFNLKNDQGLEVATTIHGTPLSRRAKFDNNNILDNRMSNGCINGKCFDLQDMYGKVDVGSKVYILPEDQGNQFQIVDGKPVLKVNAKNRAKYNEYVDQTGQKRKGQGANQSINTLQYKPITSTLDEKAFKNDVYQANDFNDDNEYTYTTKPYVNALVNNKQKIMQATHIPSDVYNEIAKMSFGIYGTESNFGDTHSALGNFGRAIGKWWNPKGSSSPDYQSKATTYGADEESNSVGLTQMRWSYLNKDEKDALTKLGITSNKDLLNAEKAAIATTAVLAIRYNQQLTDAQKKDIWTNLPTKWNTRANYGSRVKNNSKYLTFKQLDEVRKKDGGWLNTYK
jgi:LysM repeat protein